MNPFNRISPAFVSLGITFFLAGIMTFFSADIPFFWDEVYYIQAAHDFFDSGFATLIPGEGRDPGHFSLYGFYMALSWKLFGKSLVVSHIALLPVILGIIWEYFKLALKFIPVKFIAPAMLLLIAEPALATQTILMGHDLFLVYFFLLGLNGLLSGNNFIYSLALCFLPACSIRGIFSFLALLILHLVLRPFNAKRVNGKTEWLAYLPSIVLFTCWIIYHKNSTGWMLIPPGDILYSRELLPAALMVKRTILILWQVIDSGRVFLWVFIALSLAYYFLHKKKSLHHGSMHDKSFIFLLMLLFIPLGICISYIAPLNLTTNHHYYLTTFLVSHIAVLWFFELFSFRKVFRYILMAIFCTGLITGNLWIYSGGFSNGWDSSLKILPYFKLKKELINYVRQEKINPVSVGARFPMYDEHNISYLEDSLFAFSAIGNSSFSSFHYILLSNIPNIFTKEEQDVLHNRWIVIKEFRSGQVYIKLFRRPDL
ncbi:MAG: hypothetical protein HYY40_13595 [Bacteroidetes bacterium]|nr:hypothetical protein [Bacteroidota bacterium]